MFVVAFPGRTCSEELLSRESFLVVLQKALRGTRFEVWEVVLQSFVVEVLGLQAVGLELAKASHLSACPERETAVPSL